MASKSDEATFRINIDGNAPSASKEIASSARDAAKAIGSFEEEAKALSADLRRLKGNSEDVVSAKKALKAKIDAAKNSASSLTAALVKQGVSYKAAAEAAKKYGDASGKMSNTRAALGKVGSKIGGALAPLGAALKTKLEPLGKKLAEAFGPAAKKLSAKLAPAGKALAGLGKAAKEDVGSVLPSISSALGMLASGAAIAAAAVAAVGAAVAAAGIALAAFSLHAADLYAKMGRSREALLATAKDAGNLGDHIDQLAGKVPQGTAEINELSRALAKTRIGGKATVDALNAVSQVTGAVDAGAGAKIQELITRGDKFGRMSIGAFELDGTGLDFSDVAAAYAEGSKKSVDAAVKELRMGQVPIAAGAAALRKAAEKKFGDINMRNAFSLENAPTKLKEKLQQLSSGVDMGPISKALQDAFGQLDENAPLGAAVKKFMTTFGTGLVEVGSRAIPVLLEGFKWMIVYGLKIATVFVETKNAITAALNGDGNWFEKWAVVGGEITKGLAKGIILGTGVVQNALWDLGKESIKAFKDVLGIHSPSKVFADFGEHTTDGYSAGVERGSRRASESVQNMVDMPNAPRGAAASGSNVVTVTVHIAAGSADAKELGGPQFMGALTRSITDGLAEQGLVAA